MTAAGSGPCELSPGIYAIRLHHLAGTGLQIDTIALHGTEGQRLAIEAEDYVSYYNIGGQMVQRLPVSGCVSGFVLYGLDVPGEWTQYEVPVAQAGTYEVGIVCQGGLAVDYGLRLVFTDITGTESVTWGIVKSLYE